MKLLLFFTPLLLVAQIYKVGDTLSPTIINDQFDIPHKLDSTITRCFITYDKANTKLLNNFIAQNRKKIDIKHYAIIVDTSQIPSGIYTFFVKPSMKEYTHPILQSFDEVYNKKLPYKESYISVMELNNSLITKIYYINRVSDLTPIFNK